MTELESQITAGKLQPVYVLAGENPVIYGRVVGALVEQIVTPATRAFNLDVFEAKAAGATGILNAVRTVPMMAPRRLVVVRELEGLGAEGLAALIPYLEAPAPHAVLVLHATKLDGRWKLVQLAKKKGWVHELETPRQLVPWIREEAARHGARLAEDAARRLADVVGPDLGRLASSIEQLTLYVGDGAPITAADVDELIAETRERTVFELANAVGQGNAERALHAVAALFDQRESAVGVAMMLARHVRQLALMREHLEARTPRAELPKLVGVPPFAVDGLTAQARRFSADALGRALVLLAQADLDLKGPVKAALGERIVVERLVRELLALGGGDARPGARPAR